MSDCNGGKPILTAHVGNRPEARRADIAPEARRIE
jgi:hypothetical protein